MKINELNKPDQLEEGPVWDKVKQLGAGAKGLKQGWQAAGQPTQPVKPGANDLETAINTFNAKPKPAGILDKIGGAFSGARAGYAAQDSANQTSGKIKDISMLVLKKWQEFNQAYKTANGGQDAGAEQAKAWFKNFSGGQDAKNTPPPSGNNPAQIQKWLEQEVANTLAQRAMAKVQGDLPDISGLNRQELLQLRQQLTATGLNEDILNEVDWSKVKNAVAGGAISLAALGLPGLANADAQKMTPEQIRAWVQQSVKNKTPLQAQQIVNKLNVAPTADTPAVATPAPTATPAPVKAEPAPPTVDPSVARKAVSTLPPGGASKPAPVAKPTPAPVAKAEPKTEPSKAETKKLQGKWKYSTSTHGLEGNEGKYWTLTSNNKIDLDFPYGSTPLELHVVKANGKYSVVLTSEGQFYEQDSDFDGGTVRMKFDNGPIESFRYSESSSGSTGVAYLDSDKLFDKIANSKTIKIEIPYYQAGRQVFTFDSAGLTGK
jgi:hypothetical protein